MSRIKSLLKMVALAVAVVGLCLLILNTISTQQNKGAGGPVEAWITQAYNENLAAMAEEVGASPDQCSYGRWNEDRFLCVSTKVDGNAIALIYKKHQDEPAALLAAVETQQRGKVVLNVSDGNGQMLKSTRGEELFVTWNGWETWRNPMYPMKRKQNT